MPFVQANGLKFHVQSLGHGPPVVMIHGMFLGNLASWYLSIAPTLAASHEVFLYDLRGHGKTERARSGYDLTTLTSDLQALIDGWKLGPVDLVGHSYGALIALRFALDHPDRVRRVVAVEAPFPPQNLEDIRKILEIDPDDLVRYADPDKLRAAVAEAGHDVEELMDRLLPRGMKGLLLGSKRRLRSLFRFLHFLLTECTIKEDVQSERSLSDETLARIPAPVLCVYGNRSGCRAAGDHLSRTLPNARLHELDCGHYLIIDRPAELAATIEGFLGESP